MLRKSTEGRRVPLTVNVDKNLYHWLDRFRGRKKVQNPQADTVALTIRVPPELYERLDVARFQQRRPLNEIATEAMERWIDAYVRSLNGNKPMPEPSSLNDLAVMALETWAAGAKANGRRA